MTDADPNGRSVWHSPLPRILIAVLLALLVAGCMGGGGTGGGATPTDSGASSGDGGSAAPEVSFEASQEEAYYCNSCPEDKYWSEANLTTVTLTHAGGDTLDIGQIEVRVNGNASVYGSVPKTDEWSPHYPDTFPVPDFTQTLGTNRVVEFGEGDEWRIHSYSNGTNFEGLSHERYATAWEFEDNEQCNPAMHYNNRSNNDDMPEHATWNPDSCHLWENGKPLEPLSSGDQITVVWTGGSGDPVTIYEYTVE